MATKHPETPGASTSHPAAARRESTQIPSSYVDTHGVITSTMNDIPGYRVVKVLGTVYGITVRSRNWGADIGAFLRSAVGGELGYFTNLMYKSRAESVERMVGDCMGRGGNAIIALRFDISEIHIFTQVCAYGTACIIEKIEDGKRPGMDSVRM